MDNEYTVGALCDSIASNGKKNKTIKGKVKQKNIKVKKQLKMETNTTDLPELSEKSKKRNSKNNDLPKAKKQKRDTNFVTTSLNETIETKPKFNDKNNVKPSALTKKNKNSVKFEEHIRNKKIKNENLNKPNGKSKMIQNKNKFSKKSDISFSSENVKKEQVLTIKNEKITDLEIKNKNIADFEKRIKKKKINDDNLNIPNDKSKTIQNKNKFSNKPDIKSSTENIKKEQVLTIKNEKITNLEIKNKNIANFEKRIKKKKIKDDKLNIPNDKPNTIQNKNKFSNKPDIKSSTEYIEKESRTVFVGNVPVNVKMTLIKKLFKQFGEVETTRLRSVAVKNLDVPKRVSIMKGDFHPQRDTANVYVRFKTVEEAQRALVLNATKFEGHTIRVDMALKTDHKQNKKKGIFIGNLPYNIQEDEIWEFFKDCGIISAVRLVRDNATGVSKGFGYVDFEAKESVELALQLDGKKIQNRGMRIKRIDVKPNANKGFNKQPVQFKRTNKMGRINNSSHNFQGETMKPKMQKKKLKPTKTDLMRKKIAKQLNN